jgi:hypothetical protein
MGNENDLMITIKGYHVLSSKSMFLIFETEN